MIEPHKGWLRVEEAAVRKLRDTYDKQSAYRLALAVYVTMCRVSNLEGSDTFTRRIASMADDAGLSYNATAEGLELVKSAGLVTITAKTVVGSKERAPSEYQLMRMSPTECGTSPTENGRFPQSRNSHVLPRVSKNSPKNVSKNIPKKHVLKKTSTSSDDDDLIQSLEASGCSEERIQFLERFNDYAWSHSHALLPVTIYTEELATALDLHEDLFEDLFDTVVGDVENFTGESDKRLTLIRIIYDNL